MKVKLGLPDSRTCPSCQTSISPNVPGQNYPGPAVNYESWFHPLLRSLTQKPEAKYLHFQTNIPGGKSENHRPHSLVELD